MTPEPAPSGPPPNAPPEGRGVNATRAVGAFLMPLVAIIAVVSAYQWVQSTTANRGVVVLVALVVGVAGVFVMFFGLDRITDLLPFRHQEGVRPWVFVGPALLLLTIFLLYPAVRTIIVSLQDANSQEWVGLDNYRFVFTDPSMLRSIRNTLAWIVVVPTFAVAIGLIVAVLTDRLGRGESLSKSMIFLPMAISFVGASVVWGFIYDYRVFGNQTGLLNGIWTAFGNDPVAWLSQAPWNNFLMMVVMIWMQTGFAMIILSAAIKSVPEDILEAARIDGATELQIFGRITIPSIMSAIVVVTTTLVINVLKIFDIVWVLGAGSPGVEVIAERMIRFSFSFRNSGQGAAVAVLLFAMVVPVMIWNIKRFRAEEEIR